MGRMWKKEILGLFRAILVFFGADWPSRRAKSAWKRLSQAHKLYSCECSEYEMGLAVPPLPDYIHIHTYIYTKLFVW
jgi:hypothetical protein